jgi:hypothetical protein
MDHVRESAQDTRHKSQQELDVMQTARNAVRSARFLLDSRATDAPAAITTYVVSLDIPN